MVRPSIQLSINLSLSLYVVAEPLVGWAGLYHFYFLNLHIFILFFKFSSVQIKSLAPFLVNPNV